MQEIRHDGTDELTEQATMEDFEKAMADKRNASVALHKPGAKFYSNTNGVQYRVTQDAKLKPIRKAKRKEQRKSRKRNRR